MRNIRIIKNQANNISWKQRFNLLKTALFVEKSILVYSQELSGTAVKYTAWNDGEKIEKGNISTLALAEQKKAPLPWEFKCHKYDKVEDFFIVSDGEGIQHISWIYFHHHRNRILSLSEDEAEIKFCLTLPKFRGQGIYPKVLCAIKDYLISVAVRRVFICADRNNHPSIRGIEKAGFKRAGEVRLRKFMGIQISSRLDTKRIQ